MSDTAPASGSRDCHRVRARCLHNPDGEDIARHIREDGFAWIDLEGSTFVPVLERVDDQIDALEDAVIQRISSDQLQAMFSLKRDLVSMRRVVAAMRDMFQRRRRCPGSTPTTSSTSVTCTTA